MTEHDPVNHPSHYTNDESGVECIDAIEAAFTFEEASGFRKINAFKYLWRAGKKGDELEDLKKAQWYLDRQVWAMQERHAAEAVVMGGFAEGGKTAFLQQAKERARAEYTAGVARAAMKLDMGATASVGSPNESITDPPRRTSDHADAVASGCHPPFRGSSGS